MPKTEFVEYRGERFYLQTTGRYFQSGRKDATERLLHRRIYADLHGPIPAGHDVHHKDDNWRNSVPSNLELKKEFNHGHDHMVKRLADPKNMKLQMEWLGRAREAAKKWHSSPDGLKFHKRISKLSWKVRKKVKAKCINCGLEYKTYFPSRSRFCSNACVQAATYKRHFTAMRDCKFCGRTFAANKFKKVRFCSRSCSNRWRVA